MCIKIQYFYLSASLTVLLHQTTPTEIVKNVNDELDKETDEEDPYANLDIEFKEWTPTMEFDDVSKILKKVQAAEESECFDELRKLYIRMNTGEDVWEMDKFEPNINADQF